MTSEATREGRAARLVARSKSQTSLRAEAFVAARLGAARLLGRVLADDLDDPEAFDGRLREGLAELADPEYAAAQPRVAPGIGPVLGVRTPLLRAVVAELRAPLSRSSPATAVYLADRLSRADLHEPRMVALAALERSLPADPERSWQLLRRLARSATEWVSVDSLADLVAQGILLERYRWAELEQLVYSPHRWERRLVGSTVARLPYRLPPAERRRLADLPALELLETLIGDADPDVQKALSWGLRSWHLVDPSGVEAFLAREADEAAAHDDGHRAWVIRDASPALGSRSGAAIRERLAGVRKRPGSPSTSRAAEVAAPFLEALPDGHTLAEAPLR